MNAKPGHREVSRHGVSALSRLKELLRPHRGMLAAACLMFLGLTAVNIVIPQLVAVVFNDVFPNGSWGLLFAVLGAMFGLYALRNLLYFGGKYLSVTVGEHVCFVLRRRLFERLQLMSLRYHRRNQPGQLSSRVMNDSFVVQQFIQDELPTLLQALLLFIGVVATIYVMNWQLALASTVVLPLHIAAYYYFRRPIKSASTVTQRHLADATGNLIEKLLGIEVVKGFAGEERENLAFEQAIDRSRRSELLGKRYHVLQKVLADLLVGLGLILLIGFGAFQVMGRSTDKALSPGDFIAFFWYIRMLYPTVIDMMSGSAKLARTSAGLDRVNEVLNLVPDEPQVPGALVRPIHGGLEFQGVGFTYPGGSEVLRGIDFSVRPGEVCAILGASGVGKSTLISLIARLNEPSTGRVLLDGTDIRQFALNHLRGSVGMAFQESFLFRSTVFENLRYARPDAGMQQIVEAAKRVGIHEVILNLPKGYDTVVGDAGLSLSRGQKQQITLARALLKEPKVLILDEATSSIDEATESAILPQVFEFMQDRTTLMVTHRPALLKHADKVIHIQAGKVIYDGPPSGFDRASFSDSGKSPASSGPTVVVKVPTPGGVRAIDQTMNLLAAGLLCFASLTAGGQPAYADQGVAPSPAAVAEHKAAPAESTAGKLIPQPGMSANELAEMLAVVAAGVQAELGYRLAEEDETHLLNPPPRGFDAVTTLARPSQQGLRLLQIGYRSFVSQPGQVWLIGRATGGGAEGPNADLDRVVQMIQKVGQSYQERMKSVAPADLKTARIELSYIEADRCLAILKSLGIQTIEYTKTGEGVGRSSLIEPTGQVDTAKLPAVMLVPGPEGVGLVGAASEVGGDKMSVATDLPNMTSASPLMHLLVFYHPHRPEQYARTLDLIRRSIDLPARQIVIEAMVLEISETGLKQLGIEWELSSPFVSSSTFGGLDAAQLGRFPTITGGPTLDLTIGNIANHWQARIQALITSRQAEILSRPSVLTLDNRQASIRVGEDIPVATSVTGTLGGDQISFNFKYIPVGILLNVRPRVSADGEEVSMQIDAIVSAQVPGEDLIIVDNAGDELARAPRIASRRVQTQARIANNTPFIIGGLVSKDAVELQEKVPLLGDLPFIGNLFKSTTSDRLKREVIIVITPYVLPKDQLVGRNLPEDNDTFDSFDNELFRDAYRIRAEDVFDLRFLFENLQVQKMLTIADQVLGRRPELAGTYPFDRFADSRVPGERILVYRQMYEVIKRRGIDDRANPSRMIFFKDDPQSPAGFQVEFFESYLADRLGVTVPEAGASEGWLFDGLKDKAVAMIFTEREPGIAIDAPTQPVPKIKLIDCPDREAWGSLLWELNQPDAHGRRRFTILLKDERDIRRLRRAVVVKHTVQLNATHQSLRLRNFTQGRLLLVPSIMDDQVFLIDEDVAQYFFYTEHYYPALQKELQRDMEALQTILQDPDYRRLLDDPADINRPLPWKPTGR